ncbi:uncharacterized protein LOC113523533 [Galleria mellonella]|uniref:Uncharacterized protein LOC113523533 n=1 Tax=Galleria mellonella TaxID=7137 RepID=A0ABM3N4C4_GALME|nr:uncharacterized protein LOC113523533 [Galleria mellonella]
MDFALFIFVAGCLQYTIGEYVRVENLLSMQQGIGWPHSLTVVEGHQALMKLSITLENQQSCEVTTPAGERFNVLHPPNSRYEKWTGGCGLRVRHVEASDEGRWRLTAFKPGRNITGWSEIHVEENLSSYPASPISIIDGEKHKEIELTTLNNNYCLVTQPFSESSLVSGHCRVTIDRATRAIQGNWNVLLGIPGRVSEMHVGRRVDVEAERLDVGYVHDTASKKLHLYCNILHTIKNITFCRFQKTGAEAGYNIMDGISDGSHSYYGNGFAEKHCGITLENPTPDDYTTWRCSVGVKQWVGTHTKDQTPLQALISVPQLSGQTTIKRNTNFDGIEERVIFVQENMTFSISCQSNISLAYCWFQHPNGSQFTPLPQLPTNNEDQLFWYTGESLQTGECGITFTHVKKEDAGQWTCHMGPTTHSGIELTDQVTVRVTGPLAANVVEVPANIGGEATLYCHTSNGNKPLNYCRFLSPRNLGITIDSSVTQENAILQRYYFTPERHLDYGDCSLTINPVHAQDLGEWTCAAVINESQMEARDVIVVYFDKSAPLSRAGIIGMVIGLLVLVGILAGFVGYKRGWKIPNLSINFPGRRSVANMQIQDDRSSVTSTSSSTQDIVQFDVISPVAQPRP